MFEYFREKLHIPVPLHDWCPCDTNIWPFPVCSFSFLSRCDDFLRNRGAWILLMKETRIFTEQYTLRRAESKKRFRFAATRARPLCIRPRKWFRARIDGKAVLIPVPRIFGLYARNNGRTVVVIVVSIRAANSEETNVSPVRQFLFFFFFFPSSFRRRNFPTYVRSSWIFCERIRI